jgi:Family of unknown function (DUF6325)
MNIGPLEYVVISTQDQQLSSELISELDAIQESGQIYVVDLIFVTKAADGAVTLREMSELIEKEPEKYGNIAGNLMGLFTAEDIEQLIGPIPPDTSVLVILFEHAWAIGLTEAVRKSGGVVFSGGIVSHEVLAHISAELAAGKDGQNA